MTEHSGRPDTPASGVLPPRPLRSPGTPQGATSGESDPLCGGCNPPPPGAEITQTVWLCPEHKAQDKALMEKFEPYLIKRTGGSIPLVLAQPQPSREEELTERVRALEGRLARLADDARAALSETTYGDMERQHRLMANALYAVTQALHGKTSGTSEMLLTLATNTLNECGLPVYGGHSGGSRTPGGAG